jgi:hypothetical protein
MLTPNNEDIARWMGEIHCEKPCSMDYISCERCACERHPDYLHNHAAALRVLARMNNNAAEDFLYALVPCKEGTTVMKLYNDDPTEGGFAFVKGYGADATTLPCAAICAAICAAWAAEFGGEV